MDPNKLLVIHCDVGFKSCMRSVRTFYLKEVSAFSKPESFRISQYVSEVLTSKANDVDFGELTSSLTALLEAQS